MTCAIGGIDIVIGGSVIPNAWHSVVQYYCSGISTVLLMPYVVVHSFVDPQYFMASMVVACFLFSMGNKPTS